MRQTSIVNLKVKLYKFYNQQIYPRFKHLRGFTKLMGILRNLAERQVPKADLKKSSLLRDREWDNLIILDACRHDYYQEQVEECKKIISAGGATPEFMEKNFSEGSWGDVTYVSGCNFLEKDRFKSWTGKNPENVFGKVVRVFESHWDYDKNTVWPEDVYEEAINNIDNDENERVIIHFMQPHNPFIKYEFDAKTDGMYVYGEDLEKNDPKKFQHIMALGESDQISNDQIIQGYKSNIDYVMKFVRKLSNKLDGKTVVTADHGELLGEKGLYGHSYGSKAKPVREVPWHEV